MPEHTQSWVHLHKERNLNHSFHGITLDESFSAHLKHSIIDFAWGDPCQVRMFSCSLLAYQEKFGDTTTRSLQIK